MASKDVVIDWDAARRQYASTRFSGHDWLQVFEDRPDVFWDIMIDLFSLAKDEEDRENGIRRVGRRPKRMPSSIDELFQTVIPDQFSDDAFHVAFTRLLGTRSLSSFALKTGIGRATIQRYANGSRIPDLPTIALIAKNLKVPAHFFIEYRAGAVGEAVTALLTTNPHLSRRVVLGVQKNRAA